MRFQELVDCIEQELNDPSVKFSTLQNARAHHEAPRRALWIPRSGLVEPTNQAGSRQVASAESAEILYIDRRTVVAEIRAESFDDTEELWRNLLVATKDALGTASTPGPYDWVTQQKETAGEVFAGRELIAQAFEWQLYVTKRPVQEVTVTTIDHTCVIQPFQG